jgi:hypothetical protein
MISQVHLKYVFEMNAYIVLMLYAKDLKIIDLSTYISKSLALLNVYIIIFMNLAPFQ